MNRYGRIIFCAVMFIVLTISCAFGNATDDLLKLVQTEKVTTKRIEKLLNAGADINGTDNHGYSVLINAIDVAEAKPEIVKFLINAGADVNVQGKFGYTALILATMHCCHPDIINSLINAGANLNVQDEEGLTALMMAANSMAFRSRENPDEPLTPTSKEYAKIVNALLKAGADINIRDKEGKTALLHAAWTDADGSTGGNALNPDVIKILAEKGADVNAQDNDGMTAMMYAADSRWLDKKEDVFEAVKILIDAGADVNLTDNWGRTALMIAASNAFS